MGGEQKIKIFGHHAPDTDAVVSAIVYAWYYTEVKQQPAEAFILDGINKETEFVLNRFGFDTPRKLDALSKDDQVVVVDTNNLDELPEALRDAKLLEVIDHHKLFGGLNTPAPVTVTLRPMASTASLIYTVINPELHKLPAHMAGLMLAAILSDTLEFRSPTTTDEDKLIAKELADIAKVDLHELAEKMFEAKSDVSHLSAEELLKMDSKVFEIKGRKLRISVIETTRAESVIARKGELLKAMSERTETDEILLFVVDILKESATPILATSSAKRIVSDAFNVDCEKDGAVLKGIVSRKKQIVPTLER